MGGGNNRSDTGDRWHKGGWAKGRPGHRRYLHELLGAEPNEPKENKRRRKGKAGGGGVDHGGKEAKRRGRRSHALRNSRRWDGRVDCASAAGLGPDHRTVPRSSQKGRL